jgi:hypothetical protein
METASAMSEALPLIAYQIHEQTGPMELHAAAYDRDWMSEATQRFPYRCLPLNMANQHGWIITCPTHFRAYWYGGPNPTDVEVQFIGPENKSVVAHFGLGTVTFSLPWLFRTPPGINLWVKGPANWIKDGIQPLEGIVETDWPASTFTMNWKITRPNEWIEFQQGDPICMIVPIQRGFLENMVPKIELLASNPELHDRYNAWQLSRGAFLEGLKTRDPQIVKQGWQKDYFQGKPTEADTFEGHQTRINLAEFRKDTP